MGSSLDKKVFATFSSWLRASRSVEAPRSFSLRVLISCCCFLHVVWVSWRLVSVARCVSESWWWLHFSNSCSSASWRLSFSRLFKWAVCDRRRDCSCSTRPVRCSPRYLCAVVAETARRCPPFRPLSEFPALLGLSPEALPWSAGSSWVISGGGSWARLSKDVCWSDSAVSPTWGCPIKNLMHDFAPPTRAVNMGVLYQRSGEMTTEEIKEAHCSEEQGCVLWEGTRDSERSSNFVVAEKETGPPMDPRGAQPHRGFGKLL